VKALRRLTAGSRFEGLVAQRQQRVICAQSQDPPLT
jgi:hypothetical protein